MKFFNKLKFKYGNKAPQNMMLYLCIAYVAGFILHIFLPRFYWIFYPTSYSLLGLLMIYVYYTIGRNLEIYWGAFEFDWFVIMGLLLHILAGLLTGLPLTLSNFNLSLLLAFMATFPDAVFRLFFIIPIKAKWLGIAYVVMTVINFIGGSATGKVEILVSLINFVLFFFLSGKMSSLVYRIKNMFRKR